VDSRRSLDRFSFVWTPQREDGGRDHLREVLDAQLRSERAHGARRLAGAVEIALAVPVWLCAARPSWFAFDLRRLFLTAFALGFAALVAATLFEWRYRRRCLSLVQAGIVRSSRAPARLAP
jgi:hypothetical protein